MRKSVTTVSCLVFLAAGLFPAPRFGARPAARSSPFAVTANDARRIHGNDERIPVKSFQAGVRLMERAVYDFCRR